MMKNKHLYARMSFAVSGFKVALLSEKSFRFQLCVALLTLIILVVIRPPLYWWGIIIILIGLVLAAELFNTALEIICDYVQPEYHDAIKRAKDVSAAAVLVISIAAAVTGGLFLVDVFLR